MKKIILFMLFFCMVSIAYAHQPRIVTEELTIVQNPEISQAFYGELEGSPEYFQINSAVPFKLYVQVLVPDIENIDKDVSVEIKKDDEILFLLDDPNHEWTHFYEEFAGDSYYEGPEMTQDVKAGTYHFRVYSPDNQGKYVFVVGKKEEFPLKEWVNTIVTLPKLKKFFGKSPFTAFFNLIGLSLLIIVLIIAGLIALAVFLFKRLKH